jgi:large subunit ribosomal protein L22
VAATETRQEVRAQAKFVRSSARKARLVTDLIRGRTVPEARTILAFSQRAVARDVEKVLRSAVANAEANHGLDGDDLVVGAAYADEGPTLKRWRARARGRVGPIKKRMCHITVKLVPAPEGVRTSVPVTEEPTRRRRRSQAAEPAAAAAAATEAEVTEEEPVAEAEPEVEAGEEPEAQTEVEAEAEADETTTSKEGEES